jgi:heptose I phosphotransferase
MTIILREEYAAVWSGKDAFQEVDKIQGKVYRELEGRRTLRFEKNGKSYFLKSHKGIGWKEIFKNLLQLRLPILGAKNEKEAIEKLSEVGVGTMSMAAFGERGGNPAQQESFIITDAIEPSVSLEELAIEWREKSPTVLEKRKILMTVCDMTKKMHQAGVNHRDFYICHFLLKQKSEKQFPDLALIDLHRALIHKKIPYRWLLKDLASLYYSAIDVPLTQRDKLRFIKYYSNGNLREALSRDNKLWVEVERKANKLYQKALRKGILL